MSVGVSETQLKFFDKTVSYFVSVGEGEELREIEDDGHQEKGESVTKPRLRAETELKAMDRLLQITKFLKSSNWTFTLVVLNVGLVNASLHLMHLSMPSCT